jgi:hypothetical protein
MGETAGDGTGGGARPDVVWMTGRLVMHILENVRPDAERAAVQKCVLSFLQSKKKQAAVAPLLKSHAACDSAEAQDQIMGQSEFQQLWHTVLFLKAAAAAKDASASNPAGSGAGAKRMADAMPQHSWAEGAKQSARDEGSQAAGTSKKQKITAADSESGGAAATAAAAAAAMQQGIKKQQQSPQEASQGGKLSAEHRVAGGKRTAPVEPEEGGGAAKKKQKKLGKGDTEREQNNRDRGKGKEKGGGSGKKQQRGGVVEVAKSGKDAIRKKQPSKCPHQRQKSQCKECGGGRI